MILINNNNNNDNNDQYVYLLLFIFAAEGGQLPSQREQQQLEREQDARGSQWPRHVPIYNQCGQWQCRHILTLKLQVPVIKARFVGVFKMGPPKSFQRKQSLARDTDQWNSLAQRAH